MDDGGEINMKRKIGVIAAVISVFLALVAPLAVAHVIEAGQGTITASVEEPYVYFLVGPDGTWVSAQVWNASGEPTSSTYPSKLGVYFSMNLPLTNDSYIYAHNVLEIYVTSLSGAYVYVPNIFLPSTNNYIKYLFMIVTTSSGTQVANVTLVSDGAPESPANTGFTITSGGTYYVSFEVVPSTPVPYPASGFSETVTLYIAAEEPTSNPVAVPVVTTTP